MFEVFAGVRRIVHAGDVGSEDVLVLLESVAPVVAVRGNMDRNGSVARLPARATLVVEGLRFVVQHVPFGAGRDLDVAGADVLINGHTHVPMLRADGAVLRVNPGAVSQPRSGYGPTVALVAVEDGRASAEIIDL